MDNRERLYKQLKDRVQAWWDELYPAKIFTGVSGDEGAVKVAEIREILEKIDKIEKGD